MRSSVYATIVSLELACAGQAHAADVRRELAIGVDLWRVVPRESGPDDYYAVVRGSPTSFIRGWYHPPERTAVLGFQVPVEDRSRVRTVRWTWRPLAFPRGGDECKDGRQDSAAVVYLIFRRALRWYTLKYVWSSVGPKGGICDRKRGIFSTQDTIILESGGPVGVWKTEEVDLKSQFRAHFESGRDDADVPPFVGVGLMCDGDQTASESAADFADFVLSY
jgi:hypothetical protein